MNEDKPTFAMRALRANAHKAPLFSPVMLPPALYDDAKEAFGDLRGFARSSASVGDIETMSLANSFIEKAVASISAETEHWLAKAMARGDGYRVWRSDPLHEQGPGTLNYSLVSRFQMLAPGEDAPGTGMIFTPPSDQP